MAADVFLYRTHTNFELVTEVPMNKEDFLVEDSAANGDRYVCFSHYGESCTLADVCFVCVQ